MVWNEVLHPGSSVLLPLPTRDFRKTLMYSRDFGLWYISFTGELFQGENVELRLIHASELTAEIPPPTIQPTPTLPSSLLGARVQRGVELLLRCGLDVDVRCPKTGHTQLETAMLEHIAEVVPRLILAKPTIVREWLPRPSPRPCMPLAMQSRCRTSPAYPSLTCPLPRTCHTN